ncbi:MAG TPA: discoidin domain-containing protein [Acidimicrobiales bacterium]|nr:discoidin domain-containing protein [Acidimicrobiales bacterium]
MQVSPAPDGTEATVHLVTNPATVCAIAYGRTAALGSIADDPQMGGTAITHHVVFLTGLSPATTYHYRLTATDARGQVFQTQSLQSFTTPKAARGATGNGFGPDIAVGAKVVAVSSQYSSGYRGAYAVDGNLSTEWATSGDGNRAFITIDLGRRRKITGVAFITRTMSDGSSITRTYSVVADNSKTYGPFHAGSALNPEVSRVSFTARFLRFQVDTSTGGNTGALEVEAFSGAAG